MELPHLDRYRELYESAALLRSLPSPDREQLHSGGHLWSEPRAPKPRPKQEPDTLGIKPSRIREPAVEQPSSHLEFRNRRVRAEDLPMHEMLSNIEDILIGGLKCMMPLNRKPPSTQTVEMRLGRYLTQDKSRPYSESEKGVLAAARAWSEIPGNVPSHPQYPSVRGGLKRLAHFKTLLEAYCTLHDSGLPAPGIPPVAGQYVRFRVPPEERGENEPCYESPIRALAELKRAHQDVKDVIFTIGRELVPPGTYPRLRIPLDRFAAAYDAIYNERSEKDQEAEHSVIEFGQHMMGRFQ